MVILRIIPFVLSLGFIAQSVATDQSPTLEYYGSPLKVEIGNENQKKTNWFGPILEEFESPVLKYDAIRPFYLDLTKSSEGVVERSRSFLYPLFIHRDYQTHHQWSIFSLIRWSSIPSTDLENFEGDLASYYKKSFEIFPFYFDYDSRHEHYDYFAIFPFYGELKNRLFYERISWVLFPLYSEWERRDAKTTAYLWPFIRHRTGPDSSGFAIWPLFGSFQKEDDYQHQFALWPLIYNHTEKQYLDVPHRKIGFLPFYTRETREGYRREDFIWPFFGYTHQLTPKYDEVRYLWPIFVQGRGVDRYLNQIAPLYSISKRGNTESYWVLWPIYNLKKKIVGEIEIKKQKVLYFLYQDTIQRTAKTKKFLGTKKHLWPLYSYWEDAEGRKQFQLLSILEPLFADNEIIRKKYSPIFSIYREDIRGEDDKDVQLLFSLIHFERRPDYHRLDVGPLFGYYKGDDKNSFHLLKGLLGYKSELNNRTFRFLWIPFKMSENNDSESNR